MLLLILLVTRNLSSRGLGSPGPKTATRRTVSTAFDRFSTLNRLWWVAESRTKTRQAKREQSIPLR